MSEEAYCRLCAMKIENCIKIYDEEGKKLNLATKISQCLQIWLYPEDVLPKAVCTECCSKVNLFFDFFQVCSQSQISLMSMFKEKEEEQKVIMNEIVQIKHENLDLDYEDEANSEARDESNEYTELAVPEKYDELSVLRLDVCNEVSIKAEPLPEEEQVPTDDVITPVAADPHDPGLTPVQSLFASGVHFLSHDSLTLLVPKIEPLDEPEESSTTDRREPLEYLIQEDGSVVCKWCGEVLPSRTHWYRHKYKFHVQSPPGSTTLFKCHRCNVFFKSRQGYHGHITTRHSGVEKKPTVKDENDSITISGFKELELPPSRGGRSFKHLKDIPVEEYVKQREKEEKLVADIIEKVKKECAAQGSSLTRRGYTRRQTVMNS